MPADAADLSPSQAIRPLTARTDWRPWVGGAVSLGLLGSVLFRIGQVSPAQLAAILRFGPAFWATFAALYMSQSIADLVIFRRLWKLPAAGLGAILRKNVINEIVLGYSGEVYFYLWARRRGSMRAAPFAAIKDVNILSAIAGNGLTLAMLALCVSAMGKLDLGHLLGPTLWSGLAVVGLSLVVMALGRRIFSLGRDDLRFVARVHCVRLLATTALTVLLWSLAAPDAPLRLLMVLVTFRLLVSRLPLVTNKDLVFANVAFLILGPKAPLAVLMAALSLATLVAHLVVLGGATLVDLRKSAST